MATNWSPVNAFNGSGTSGTVNVTVSGIANGSLIIAHTISHRATTQVTAISVSDNGANSGWSTIGAFMSDAPGSNRGQAFWRKATSADSSLTTVTFTYTGGSGLTSNQGVVENYSVTGGTINGIDLAASTGSSSSTTTHSLSPASGSTESSNTDELAWTSLMLPSSSGTLTTNTFTGTSSAANLAVAAQSLDTVIIGQYVGGVQASSTAGTNVWENSWTNSLPYMMAGATFYYTATATATYVADQQQRRRLVPAKILHYQNPTYVFTPAIVSAPAFPTPTIAPRRLPGLQPRLFKRWEAPLPQGIIYKQTLLKDASSSTAFTPYKLGDLLILNILEGSNNTSTTTVTSSNAIWTKGVEANDGAGSNLFGSVWIGSVTSLTSSAVTITFGSGGSGSVNITVVEFTTNPYLGPNTIWGPIASAQSTSTSAVTAPNVTASMSGALVYYWTVSGNNLTPPTANLDFSTVVGNTDLVQFLTPSINNTTYQANYTSSAHGVSLGVVVWLQYPPIYQVIRQRMTQLMGQRRIPSHSTFLPQPQINPPFIRPTISTAHTIRGMRRFSGSAPFPVQHQLNPPFPFPTVSQPKRIRGMRRFKGSTPLVVQPQVNPPFPFPTLRARLRLLSVNTRPKTLNFIQAQVQIAPSYVPGNIRRQVRLAGLRKINLIQYPFPQITIPATGYPEIIFVDGHPALHVAGLWYTLIG